MILQSVLFDIIEAQNNSFKNRAMGLIRENISKIPSQQKFATIISGIRRCGKSTLLLQLMQKKYSDALILNFEDVRLNEFEAADFKRVYTILMEKGIKTVFFDEIQLIDKWEVFVNQLLDEGFKVFVSGSNATMLSKELGTNLTGRHLSIELFPFSYTEFIRFNELTNNSKSVKKYIQYGGFPEFIKSENPMILNTLLTDILIRDIAVRYAIRDISSLKKIAVFLISNIGKPVSANNISKTFQLKAVSTVVEYFNHLQDAYLLEFIPQFSYSLKAQQRNPKKVYCIDTGLVSEVSNSFSNDMGRKLENLIYISLRRKYKDIYFYKNKGECDFLVFENRKLIKAFQVCYELDDINQKREIDGLLDVLNEFKLFVGQIITFNQNDVIQVEDKTIEIVSADRFLS